MFCSIIYNCIHQKTSRNSAGSSMKIWDIAVQVLEVIIPSCYMISNKTVLSIHNFRFPSVFLSWQLLISLIVIFVLLKSQILESFSAREIQKNVKHAIMLASSLFFGSRSLAVLPIPTFLVGQALCLHTVCVIASKTRKNQKTWYTLSSTFIILLLLFNLTINLEVNTLLCFAIFITVSVIRSLSSQNVDYGLPQSAAIMMMSITLLMTYGTISGELMSAGNVDFTRTHFLSYLFCSGILSGATFMTKGWSFQPGKLGSKTVIQFLVVFFIGHWYEFPCSYTTNEFHNSTGDLLLNGITIFITVLVLCGDLQYYNERQQDVSLSDFSDVRVDENIE